VAKLYLGCKLVSIAIIEALSLRLARDIPLSTLMGELPIQGSKTPSLEEFIPNIQSTHKPEIALEREVLELLTKGRNQDSNYDLKNSPIATFIVNSMGFPSVRYLISQAKEFFAETISPDEFLKECDPNAIATIIDGIEKLFTSRVYALRGLSEDTTLASEPSQATKSTPRQELASEAQPQMS
jgi:hypothetical protein